MIAPEKLAKIAYAILIAECEHNPNTWDDTSPESWPYEALERHGYIEMAKAAIAAYEE